jgi:hypothetical protein
MFGQGLGKVRYYAIVMEDKEILIADSSFPFETSWFFEIQHSNFVRYLVTWKLREKVAISVVTNYIVLCVMLFSDVELHDNCRLL